MKLSSVKTSHGVELKLDIKNGMVNSKIIHADIGVSNGVCHMIDSILMP
jgi:uncharacterized surface protein with fasciclin (FAS1) repeats